jgi:hypothetical protein
VALRLPAPTINQPLKALWRVGRSRHREHDGWRRRKRPGGAPDDGG